MERLRLCIVIAALCGTYLVGQVQTPSTVSVTSGESPKLIPGQTFEFQLRFNKAPEGYGEGKIQYQFDNVALSGRSVNDQKTVLGYAALHDGQAIYSLSLPILESMDKGKWKLVSVVMGKATMKDVPITGDVVFEVPLPPPFIHIRAPEKVVAGTTLHFEILLDRIPELPPDCTLHFRFRAAPAMQVSGFNGGPVEDVAADSGRHPYEMTEKLDIDVPSGLWQGTVQLTAYPMQPRAYCDEIQFPQWSQSEFSFTVEPAPGLVSPTAVAVTVNPSQIQLLLGEADRLKAKAKHLEQQLALGNKTANQDLLRSGLLEANADLDKTEAIFKQRGGEQSSMQDVNDFFDDIRFGYREALGMLPSKAGWLREKNGQLLLLRVSAARTVAPLNASRVLKSIRRNADAYDLVASSKALTFTLDVYSEPDGATISYRRRGGEYHPVDHATDWKIENLVRAVWQIKLQKPGYEDAEEFFDAIDNTRTSITIKLTRK